MDAGAAGTEERVRRAVERATGQSAAGRAVRRLAGHASLRSYWRVGTWPEVWPPRDQDGIELGAPMHPSHVVMVLPPEAGPEEATTGGDPGVNPFVDVQRYLELLGVRVPHVLAFYDDDPAGGLMVLEDFGDEMLETQVRSGADPEPLYRQAVDQLARLRATAERSRHRCVAFTRRFDADLYLWELNHFREWLLEAWKGVVLDGPERAEVDWNFAAIARALDAEPKGFTHRDYQSRNLMVLPSGELGVIDFQDALLGPRQYDLVALLRDSYVQLPAEVVERLLARYLESFAGFGGPRLEPGPFREVFDLLTVQRKLKDAGRFVFIDRVKKNPSFLANIPVSLGYVSEALARLPGLRGLHEILGRHLPELAP